ncbi:hypothetical protein AVEN_273889-1 [Araneus ventricosus]|uniref:Uncharacterized protein n=1 Tax=Araneus ventricosus TaxID=182803 RepID=A0A4Y2HHY2_ARAVE|nr:hypothetical protein AVEN_273889-1 [Araneus ventricosus]
MPKRKRGITGDAASRREAIRKRERRVVETEEEAADCQLWHNVARIEERKKQKNKGIADCQTRHNVDSREEPRKKRNKEISRLAVMDNVRRKKQKNKRNSRLVSNGNNDREKTEETDEKKQPD